jgi:hypothetical protein
MIVALYIYVDGIAKRIELFDDEKISVTSSIQNINDISKVFTDYSQSFTIPASETNNEIFKHWYENSLDNGFDQRLRYDGYIEIDTITFRVGKWQLEGVSKKENRIENYKITFYGNLLSLSDKFKDAKLKDLNTLNNYSFTYTGGNVLARVKSATPQNVMFPFISSKRIWNIGGSGLASDNINVNATALGYKELYPAVNLPTILNAIEDKYNINFSGSFLTDERFSKAYIWFKNNEQPLVNVLGSPTIVDITGIGQTGDYFGTNVGNNTISLISEPPFNYAEVRVELMFPMPIQTRLSVYRNDVFLFSNSSTTPTPISNFANIGFSISPSDIDAEYSIYVEASESVSYTGSINGIWINDNTGAEVVDVSNTLGGTTANLLNLTALAPDIKLTDLFTGILKAFNLTAFSTDGINFTIEQLENWYYLGSIKDFSGYTTTDAEFTRVKPYKKINFEYEKSESVLNKNFSDTNSREFGNLSYTFNNDGSDYSIKLPFENLLFNKFTGTNFQVAYALKPDFNKYVPKPVFLYLYGVQSATYFFNNGTGTTSETTYNMFGQDVLVNSVRYTNNWGIEISTYDFLLVENTLFNNYYLAYLTNLYSLKSRMVKVKMRLPYLELLNLNLNDRIVIRDKRYIINQYTTDLTTFESDFELIEDFRTINFNNSGIIRTDNASKTLIYKTTSIDQLKWNDKSDVNFMISGIESFLDRVEIQIKPNISGIQVNAIIQSNLNDELIIIQDA